MAPRKKKESRYAPIEKIFCPTLELLLEVGDEGITEFRDKHGHPHAVVLAQGDYEQLRRKSRENTIEGECAAEVTNYIAGKLRQNGFDHVNRKIQLEENLTLFIDGSNSLLALLNNQDEHLQERSIVVCRDFGEEGYFTLRGYRSETRRFDNINPNIRREGVRTVEDNELYSTLLTDIVQGGKKWDAETFERHVKRLIPNQYILIYPESEPKAPICLSIMGKTDSRISQYDMLAAGSLEVRLLEFGDPSQPKWRQMSVLGVKPRDIEQALYLHALSQPHISLVFVTGIAGSGKTLLGYASALEQTLRRVKDDSKASRRHDTNVPVKEHHVQSRFDRIYLVKSNDRIGGPRRDRGYLPGTEPEKMEPFIRSYRDEHSVLDVPFGFDELMDGFGSEEQRVSKKYHESGKFAAPFAGGLIKTEDYALWRGRTLERAAILVDEAQNLRPRELKDIIARQGSNGTLLIVSGDYEYQIDNPSSSTRDNALFQGIRHFLGEPYAALIDLKGTYRGAAAERAATWKARY